MPEIDHCCTKCHKHEIIKFYPQEVTDKRYPIEDKVWKCRFCFTTQAITKEEVMVLKQRTQRS